MLGECGRMTKSGVRGVYLTARLTPRPTFACCVFKLTRDSIIVFNAINVLLKQFNLMFIIVDGCLTLI